MRRELITANRNRKNRRAMYRNLKVLHRCRKHHDGADMQLAAQAIKIIRRWFRC